MTKINKNFKIYNIKYFFYCDSRAVHYFVLRIIFNNNLKKNCASNIVQIINKDVVENQINIMVVITDIPRAK